MAGRVWLLCGGLLAAVASVAWLQAESAATSRREFQDQTERWYAVELSASDQGFSLPGPGRYELIVASLGESAREFHVDLESVPVAPVALSGNRGQSSWRPVIRLAERSGRPAGRRPALPSEIRPFAGTVTAKEVPEPESTQRRFFLHVTTDPLEEPQGYVAVTGELAGAGRRVRVYVDRDGTHCSPNLVTEIIRLMDDEILPRSRELVGEHADVDGDGKLAILATAWLGRLCGGRTSLNGFVRANDFQTGIDPPFSNHADVLYLNPAIAAGPELKTLLAHEYTHAVCFSRRFANPDREASLPPEEDWLSEAMAHVAEMLHETNWSNLDRRVACFVGAPQQAPLVVRDYYRAGLWRDPGCRGATFLFLSHCIDRFGAGLLRDLCDSDLVGRRNLERATGVPFSELFRDWTIALADDAIASLPLHGKLGDCQLDGLARIDWPVGRNSCSVDVRGTAAAVMQFTIAAEAGSRRIVVHAPPDAKLQLTVIRRPAVVDRGIQTARRE